MALLDNLVAYWKLEEDPASNGTTPIVDASGNGHTGTLTTDDGAANKSVTGKIGKGLSFDLADYVDAGANAITGTDAFTLSAWLNTNQLSAYSGALAIGASGSGLSAYIGTVATAQVGTNNSIGGGFYGTNYGSGITTTNSWFHVVLTFAGGAGGAAKLYVDSVETVDTTNTPNLSAGTIKIGRIGTDTIYDFDGEIDEVAIWDRELDSGEVAQLYNSGAGLQYPFENISLTGVTSVTGINTLTL